VEANTALVRSAGKRFIMPKSKPQEEHLDLYPFLAEDPMLWGKMYFKHHFRLKTPPFHFIMVDAAMESRQLAVAAPRESAKSTMLVFLYPFHAIVFKRKRFIVIISNTFKKAAMQLESIKAEIRENQEFRQHFPGIEIIKDAEGDSIIKHPDGFKTLVLCRGVDQIGSIRGVKFGAYRPDLIIGDDMEDDELVRSIERRFQLQEDFDTALIPAGEKGVCQYIFVGTILHDDCQMAKLASKEHYHEYSKIFFRAGENWGKPNVRSLWPEKWSLDYLRELERTKPSVFAKEYQNDPVAGANVRFKKEDFRYWKAEGQDYVLFDRDNRPISKGSLKDCRAAIACDLAWKEKRESDSSVLMPGLITPDSEILLESYVTKKGMRPEELAEHLFVMSEHLEKLTSGTVKVGFEKSALENVVQYILKREMKKRGKFLLTEELVWDADKIRRIEIRLQPRYAQHVMYHKRDMGELEYQLTRFPYGAHDDLADAAQGLVQLLQYPKAASSPHAEEDEFERVRRIMIETKKPHLAVQKRTHKYPGKHKWFEVPAGLSFR